MVRNTLRITGIFVMSIALFGCGQFQRLNEMEKVAKDWCTVIRASQIVPVYPLSEDIQVGDVFLVQTPVDKQHKEYVKRGFLPMDNLIARLEPNGFKRFYQRSFHTGDGDLILPKDWLKAKNSKSWSGAPGVSFPSYSFSVKSGGGLNMALPVQGIPIGLSLMGADAGEGTITISEAKTYGVDTISLYDKILEWERNHHAFLFNYASGEKKTNYIRVISRVFLAKKINVSVRSSQSKGANLAAGAPKPVELLTITPPASSEKVSAATTDSYTKGINALNTLIQDALGKSGLNSLLPGGSVKLISASSRSVSLVETFDRPIVVGYLGIDLKVGANGILGPPIPTHAVLEQEITPEAESDSVKLIGVSHLHQAYVISKKQAQQGKKKALLLKNSTDRIARNIPERYPFPIFVKQTPTSDPTIYKKADSQLRSDTPAFSDLTRYYGELSTSKKALELSAPSFKGAEYLTPTHEELERLHIILKQNRRILKELNEYASQF